MLWLRTLTIGLIVTFLLGKLLNLVIPRLVRQVALRADQATEFDHLLKWRRIETVLSTILAAAKVVIFFGALYVVWHLEQPTSTPVALVSASAIFAVLAGATLGSLLRDLTYGMIMMVERWYNVGDHISVEPFGSVAGVVELVTLRSTRLRNLKGEIIWLHNQHIQGVRVTPRGIRQLAFDVFVSDPVRGRKLLSEVMAALPAGPTLVVKAFEIDPAEPLGNDLWLLTARGQTAAGREWLAEDFALSAIRKRDAKAKRPVIVYGPIVRFDDDGAERHYRRSVRAKTPKARVSSR